MIVLHKSKAHRHDTPHHRQGRQPYPRGEFLQDEIAWYFTESCQSLAGAGVDKGRGDQDHSGACTVPGNVCSIENCEASIVLMISHPEIGFKLVDFGISDIRTIEE